MVTKFLNKKSKRVLSKTRFKIEKRVRQHKKKLRREEKKHPNRRKWKDPGVPNSLPFKETILQEAEQRKLRLQEEEKTLKEERKKAKEILLAKKRNMDTMVSDAYKKQDAFEKKQIISQKKAEPTIHKNIETSLKAYYKEFKKVIDGADVVLQVLDARDPLGSRCLEVEQAVLQSGLNKKLVLVLNKIDLVPKENVEAWLKHLRNEFPTIPFKASTQVQRRHLSHTKLCLAKLSDGLKQSSNCLGADILMKLLGNYCRQNNIKTTIRVGVVGFPNTGKSSLINSLKRSKACHVGAQPGITKTMQEVILDKHIKILDSPGVIMAKSSSDAATVLRNVVKIESLPNPEESVELILNRCNKEQMMMYYTIPNYKDVNHFLMLLAKRKGKLRKGGIPDKRKAAKMLLQDWMVGKIKYYTHPPEQASLPTHVSAEIVTALGKAFNVEDIQTEENTLLQSLKRKDTHMLFESVGIAKGIVTEDDLDKMEDDNEESDEDDGDEVEEDEEEEDEDMDANDEEATKKKKSVTVYVGSQKSSSKPNVAEKKKAVVKPDLHPQHNLVKKKEFKKMKKQRKRADAVAADLSESLTKAFSGDGKNDAYNFESDFT